MQFFVRPRDKSRAYAKNTGVIHTTNKVNKPSSYFGITELPNYDLWGTWAIGAKTPSELGVFLTQIEGEIDADKSFGDVFGPITKDRTYDLVDWDFVNLNIAGLKSQLGPDLAAGIDKLGKRTSGHDVLQYLRTQLPLSRSCSSDVKAPEWPELCLLEEDTVMFLRRMDAFIASEFGANLYKLKMGDAEEAQKVLVTIVTRMIVAQLVKQSEGLEVVESHFESEAPTMKTVGDAIELFASYGTLCDSHRKANPFSSLLSNTSNMSASNTSASNTSDTSLSSGAANSNSKPVKKFYYRKKKSNKKNGAAANSSASKSSTANSSAANSSAANSSASKAANSSAANSSAANSSAANSSTPASNSASSSNSAPASSASVGTNSRIKDVDYEFVASTFLPDEKVEYTQEEIAELVTVPNNYGEAKASSSSMHWQNAMSVHMADLRNNSVYSLVDRPKQTQINNCRWEYSLKLDDDGLPKYYLAELALQELTKQGNKVKQAQNVSYETVMLFFAICAQQKLSYAHIAVKNAFFNVALKKPIFMQQPQGFDDGSGRVCKLTKAVFGYRQAPHEWYQVLNEFLTTLGFVAASTAAGLFYRKKSRDLIMVYVDELVIASPSRQSTFDICHEIGRRFEMDVSADPENFLSLNITSPTIDEIHVESRSNISKLLNEFSAEILTAQPRNPDTPTSRKTVDKYIAIEDTIASNGHDEDLPSNLRPMARRLQEPKVKRYRQAVGSLIHIARTSRIDVAYVVALLSKHVQNPREIHWSILTRTLGYLDIHRHHAIVFKRTAKPQLSGYFDTELPVSQGGFIVEYGGCPIYWESKKLKLEFETWQESFLVTLNSASSKAFSIRSTLIEIGAMDKNKPWMFYANETTCDIINGKKAVKKQLKSAHLEPIYDLMEYENLKITELESDSKNRAAVLVFANDD